MSELADFTSVLEKLRKGDLTLDDVSAHMQERGKFIAGRATPEEITFSLMDELSQGMEIDIQSHQDSLIGESDRITGLGVSGDQAALSYLVDQARTYGQDARVVMTKETSKRFLKNANDILDFVDKEIKEKYGSSAGLDDLRSEVNAPMPASWKWLDDE